MRIMRISEIFLRAPVHYFLTICLIIFAIGSIVLNNRIVGNARQQMEAYPRDLMGGAYNTYEQTTGFLTELDFHLRTGDTPSREAIDRRLHLLINRSDIFAAAVGQMPYMGQTVTEILEETRSLKSLMMDMRHLLKDKQKIDNSAEQRIRKLMTEIEDQAIYLRSLSRDVVFDESISQSKLLSTYGLVVDGAIIVVTFLLIGALLLLVSLLRQSKKLQKQSRTDALTRLGNRRAFDEQLAQQMEFSLRHGVPLQMLLLDVDNFKKYNDTYGHAMGDQVLASIGKSLNNSFKRRNDQTFRIGGEEFACLYQVKELTDAIKMAEEVANDIRKLAIPHEKNTPSEIVTVSCGLVHVKGDPSVNVDILYKAADRALYSAKEKGRDRVEVSKEFGYQAIPPK